MPEVDLAAPVLAEIEVTRPAVMAAPSAIRWELWISFAAGIAAIMAMAVLLLTLTAELRAGWVPGHELPMDKATAIHKLLFR
jgi:hypothetical protein